MRFPRIELKEARGKINQKLRGIMFLAKYSQMPIKGFIGVGKLLITGHERRSALTLRSVPQII
jgi:hypothetical protein